MSPGGSNLYQGGVYVDNFTRVSMNPPPNAAAAADSSSSNNNTFTTTSSSNDQTQTVTTANEIDTDLVRHKRNWGFDVLQVFLVILFLVGVLIVLKCKVFCSWKQSRREKCCKKQKQIAALENQRPLLIPVAVPMHPSYITTTTTEPIEAEPMQEQYDEEGEPMDEYDSTSDSSLDGDEEVEPLQEAGGSYYGSSVKQGGSSKDYNSDDSSSTDISRAESEEEDSSATDDDGTCNSSGQRRITSKITSNNTPALKSSAAGCATKDFPTESFDSKRAKQQQYPRSTLGRHNHKASAHQHHCPTSASSSSNTSSSSSEPSVELRYHHGRPLHHRHNHNPHNNNNTAHHHVHPRNHNGKNHHGRDMKKRSRKHEHRH
jgi:hypothetical protein